MKLAILVSILSFATSALAWDASSFTPAKKEAAKKKLSPEQLDVTQQEGTERAFTGPYWNQHEDGIYVDIVSGEPLFSSQDKYDSHTGWPSFTKPLVKENVVLATDRDGNRMEVKSKHAQSHLGHVFDDGPAPTNQRYCMNSASLRFIPKAKLKQEGYGEFEKLFANKK